MSTRWFVSYKVPVISEDRVHIAGPYESFSIAQTQAIDIAGFGGIAAIKIYEEDADKLLDKTLTSSVL